MERSLIIALDFPSKNEVQQFLQQFGDEKLFLKVGMELFYQEGPSIVYLLKERGHQVFLDLKLHDIPETVYRAMKGIAQIGCDLVNVHAAGGKGMMEKAREGLEAGRLLGRQIPLCIAVTQLTSTSEEQMHMEQLISVPLQTSVLHYAKLAYEAGLHGVVCSSQETELLRKELGNEFITVTPGIRLNISESHDQKRVATPEEARKQGSTAIVVGRGITRAKDPVRSYWEYKKAWEDGCI